MFYFFSTQQTQQNASYHKGVLFEDLLRRFLRSAGYDVELKRRKEASLEFDLHGKHKVDGRPVVGEAKAHTDTVAAHEVTAFVGKSVDLLASDPPYSGLFLSTSAISPEAEDYLRSKLPKTSFQVRAICGAELEQQIRDELRLPNAELVRKLVADVIPIVSAQHVLHSDRGTFVIAAGSAEPSAFDDRFAVVALDSRIVADVTLLEGIKAAIQSLQGLEAIRGTASPASERVIPSRTIPEGLITATDWLDYRRPAGTPFFVGRQEALQRAKESVRRSDHGVVIEVKSKSGVGKSSLLAVLGDLWERDGHRVELHDARDVQSAVDVLALVKRFTGVGERLERFEDVPTALASLQSVLDGKLGVFLVDQFESSFASPEVFVSYEYVALCIARSAPGLAMIYARKDDLLTTHDDILINMERLRGLSESITLEDFGPGEAIELLGAMSRAHPTKLSARLLEQVLEFAQGFPWLLKRTMAHVASLLAQGVGQQELLTSGLHLEDLFEEEIAGLDEHERGYLTRIASVLPATYQSLSRRFEDDPSLREMLEKLTSRRLLRLSAGIYDTYNDVFKDFLLYERLPERSQAHLFRLGLAPVLHAFRALGGLDRVEVEPFGKQLGKSIGGTYNLLRELRLAGLVVHSSDGWIVSEVARQYEHQGRLGEFVRQSVLRNQLVSELLVRLDREGGVKKTALPSLLRARFPFVEAKEEVWGVYSNVLLDWLVRLRLVRLADEEIVPESADKQEILQSLGNLNLAGRGARPADSAFIPSIPWNTAVRVLGMVAQGAAPAELTKRERGALGELNRLGAVEEDDAGRLTVLLDAAGLEHKVLEMFAAEPYTSFWNKLLNGVRWPEAIEVCFGLHTLAPGTRTALGKSLANWGRTFGFLSKSRLSFKAPAAEETVGAQQVQTSLL